jgi:hypothetical protein
VLLRNFSAFLSHAGIFRLEILVTLLPLAAFLVAFLVVVGGCPFVGVLEQIALVVSFVLVVSFEVLAVLLEVFS